MIVESIVGALILLAVGLLGVTPPARHEQPWWPFPFRLSWAATADTPGIHLWLVGGALFATLGALALLGGALRRFDKLKHATAELPVKLSWDRRLGERRAPPRGGAANERRQAD